MEKLELLGWGTHRKQKPSPASASPSVAHAFWSVQVTSIPWATDWPVNKTNGRATVHPVSFHLHSQKRTNHVTQIWHRIPLDLLCCLSPQKRATLKKFWKRDFWKCSLQRLNKRTKRAKVITKVKSQKEMF